MGNKEADTILERSIIYYKKRPDECSYWNWILRMLAYLDYSKKVWPIPSPAEIEAFVSVTGYKPKVWRRR